MYFRPVRSTAATTSSHSFSVMHIGFSISTCLPAASALSENSACVSCHVAITTASMSGSLQILSTSSVAYAPPYFC